MQGGVGNPCICAAACRGVLTRSTVEHLVPKDLSLVLSFCSMVSGGGAFWSALPSIDHVHLQVLADQLRRTVVFDKAPSTVKVYLMAFCRWSKWASAFHLPSFPAWPHDLALYLLHLAQTSVLHSSTSQASAALHWLKQKADTLDPTRHPLFTKLRLALVRLYSRPVQRCNPLTPVQFQQTITCLASSDASLEDLQTAAMFVMGFCGFMRWDNMSGLRSQDFSFSESHITVQFLKRKNFQLRDCNQLVIARSPEDGDLCSVRVLERFLVAGKHAPADPILLRVTICRRKPDYLRGAMSYHWARELVSQTLSPVDISPERFGTHSLRAGGATAAALAHVPDRLIQRPGGWLCPESKDKYINDSLNDALSVSRAVLRS